MLSLLSLFVLKYPFKVESVWYRFSNTTEITNNKNNTISHKEKITKNQVSDINFVFVFLFCVVLLLIQKKKRKKETKKKEKKKRKK